jgi:hypothetical protein
MGCYRCAYAWIQGFRVLAIECEKPIAPLPYPCLGDNLRHNGLIVILDKPGV